MMLCTAQVRVPPEACAPGWLISCKTFTLAVLVHPLAGSVTVNTYVPGAEITGSLIALENPLGPLHANVAPAVELEPIKVRLVLMQDKDPDPEAPAIGAVLFAVTTTWSVLVQPVPIAVTTRVYVPAASTTGVALLAPLTIWPPPEALHAKVTVPDAELPLKVTWPLLLHVIALSGPALAPGVPLEKISVWR